MGLSVQEWDRQVQVAYARILMQKQKYDEALAMNMAAVAVAFGTRGRNWYRKGEDPKRVASLIWKKNTGKD